MYGTGQEPRTKLPARYRSPIVGGGCMLTRAGTKIKSSMFLKCDRNHQGKELEASTPCLATAPIRQYKSVNDLFDVDEYIFASVFN